jgi:hypothetical protein
MVPWRRSKKRVANKCYHGKADFPKRRPLSRSGFRVAAATEIEQCYGTLREGISMNSNRQNSEVVGVATRREDAGRKHWTAPSVIVSSVARNTAAKTSSGFGFETHSPGSLNGS